MTTVAALYVQRNGCPDTRRFLERISVDAGGCWLWAGSKYRSGYGAFWMRGKNYRAHRAAWTLLRGQIPDGMLICHRCDTPQCVNPDHLFLGTSADNNFDRDSKGRHGFSAPKNPASGERNGARTKPEQVRRGSQINTCKLNEQAVRLIRERHASGTSARTLAKELGMHRTTIDDLVARKTWRHV